jgi:hypothetical protein
MRQIGPNGYEVRDLTEAQRSALSQLCERYDVSFNENDYIPAFDLPYGWVSGWVGGNRVSNTIYVGCSPEGRITS